MVGAVTARSSLRRVDPEIFSAFLNALGAIGSVASISSFKRETSDTDRKSSARRAEARICLKRIMLSLENVRMGLDSLGGCIEKSKPNGRHRSSRQDEEKFRFGSNPVFLTQEEFVIYQANIGMICSAATELSRQSYRVMSLMDEGLITSDYDEIRQFENIQKDLNAALFIRSPAMQSVERALYACDSCIAVIHTLAERNEIQL